MSNTVITVLAANAAIQSSVAAQQAHEAHEATVTSCMAYMSGFQGRGASVAEARQYSSCVETVYPSTEFTVDVLGKLLVGSLMLMAIIGLIFGLYRRVRDTSWLSPGWFEVLFFYPLMGCLVWAVIWAAIAGVLYLSS